MTLNINCSGKGLKLAIEDAFESMESEETQGFSYPIGTVNGLEIRIVAEQQDLGMLEITEVQSGGLSYTAVTDLNGYKK